MLRVYEKTLNGVLKDNGFGQFKLCTDLIHIYFQLDTIIYNSLFFIRITFFTLRNTVEVP